MRVLSLVFLVLCVLCVVVPVFGQQYQVFNPNFKDPYNDAGGALLDLNVKLCQNWNLGEGVVSAELDSITVTIPTAPSLEASSNTGYFVGPAFTDFSIQGIATRGTSPPVNIAVTLLVSWDGSSKLKFRGFQTSGAAVVQVPGRGDSSLFWVNVNYDLLETQFFFPYTDSTHTTFIDLTNFNTLHPNQVPLLLVPYSPVDPTSTAKPNINQGAPNLFDAEPPLGQQPPECKGGSSTQDPIFSGFQGQVFQFHGLPDEHFNLVSSPDVQLNSHFVYLSSGKCDYNDTECYTHPGTYMDVLGLSVLDSHVKLVAGTHEAGLRIWLNDQEIPRGTHIKAFTNTSAYIKYHHNGRVEIHTEIMNFDIANSDMFMNIHVALNNHQLLRVGGIRHTVTDHAICKANTETSNHQLIEETVAAKYPVTTPLHGLIGQTWRNVKVCSKDWMGTVQDYITSDLFASDYHYNYFNW